jgi:hypothetical protein
MKPSLFSIRCLLAISVAMSLASGCRQEARLTDRERRLETVLRPTNQDASLPFLRAWQKPSGVDWAAYTQIVIAPTNTQNFVLEGEFWKVRPDLAEKAGQDAAVLSEQMTGILREAFAANPKLQIVEPFTINPVKEFRGNAPEPPKTLLLATAILELTPNQQTAQALGVTSTPAGVANGAVALEARIEDYVSTEILATISDRELSRTGGDSSAWHSHAKPVMETWAKQLSDSIEMMEKDQPISDSTGLAVRPW